MRLRREGEISLMVPQRKWATSHVEGIIWFFSSCSMNLGVPLGLRRGSQGPARVASGKSSLYARCEGPLRIPLQSVLGLCPHLELRPEPQGSSPVLTWISGFLWSFNRVVRPHLMWRHASPLSSRAGKTVSGFLSSSHRDWWLSLKVPQHSHICHRVSDRSLG